MIRRLTLATAAVVGLLLMSASLGPAPGPTRYFGLYVPAGAISESLWQPPSQPLHSFVIDGDVPRPYPRGFRLHELEAAGADLQFLAAKYQAPQLTLTEAEFALPAGYDPGNPYGLAPPDSGEGRRIVYSNSEQMVWWINEDNWVVNRYLVSGKRGMPKTGNYQVYSKSEKAYGLYGGITMEYMVRFAYGPNGISIGFHSLPVYPNGQKMQTVAELGHYRSGGCVRQADDIAKALFEWADIGTPVVVIP